MCLEIAIELGIMISLIMVIFYESEYRLTKISVSLKSGRAWAKYIPGFTDFVNYTDCGEYILDCICYIFKIVVSLPVRKCIDYSFYVDFWLKISMRINFFNKVFWEQRSHITYKSWLRPFNHHEEGHFRRRNRLYRRLFLYRNFSESNF